MLLLTISYTITLFFNLSISFGAFRLHAEPHVVTLGFFILIIHSNAIFVHLGPVMKEKKHRLIGCMLIIFYKSPCGVVFWVLSYCVICGNVKNRQQ